MTKLLFLSAIISLVVIPIRYARTKSARLGLRRALVTVAAVNVIYWLVVLFGYYHFWVGMDPRQALESVHD